MAKGGKKCSRSSPKKLGREVAESTSEVYHDQEWVKSTTTQKILEGMVFEGILRNQVTAEWRPAIGEPTPDTSELIVFVAYFVHGFRIPAHPFLQKLLGYYDISLCHLHPNSILHISLFINLCETFIGITPHFNLSRYFFYLKPFYGSGSPKVVNDVYLQLRDEMLSGFILEMLNRACLLA